MSSECRQHVCWADKFMHFMRLDLDCQVNTQELDQKFDSWLPFTEAGRFETSPAARVGQ